MGLEELYMMARILDFTKDILRIIKNTVMEWKFIMMGNLIWGYGKMINWLKNVRIATCNKIEEIKLILRQYSPKMLRDDNSLCIIYIILDLYILYI